MIWNYVEILETADNVMILNYDNLECGYTYNYTLDNSGKIT